MTQFIDLKTQYARIEPQVEEAIKKVLQHGRYILGPEVSELETVLKDFAGTDFCVGCSSGTDALLMALLAYDVGPGDAIFTSPFTFFATAEVIALTGATPVFVDIAGDTWNIVPELLEREIEKVKAEDKLKARGVIPVDIFGLCANYDQINPIAKQHGMFVIQDAAQSFGAEINGKKAPSMGDIGCTSFFPAKPLGAYGDGGACFTDCPELNEKLLSILVHGRSNDKYDNVRLGLNARLDTIQAAVLIEKMKLFPEEIELRQKAAGKYRTLLGDKIKLQQIPAGCKSVYAQFCMQADNFAEIQTKLQEAEIPTARYYPLPLHLQGAFKYLGYSEGSMPVSEAVAKNIFAVPMHPYLDEETIEKIAGIITANA